MSDFGACKGCGRVYSLTRLKACPRCGDIETNSIEEVRIPTTIKNDLTFVLPESADKSDLITAVDKILPITTPCKNCGRDFRSDKLESCPRCGHQSHMSPPESTSSSDTFQSGPESRCTSCNKSFPQAFEFCPSCGTALRTSSERQISDKQVLKSNLEARMFEREHQSIPLSEQRQTKNKKVKNLIVVISSISIFLILGALIVNGMSPGSPAPTKNGDSVESDQGTSKIVRKCYDEVLPNPAYDPTDFMSSKTYFHKVCQFLTITTP